MPISRCVTNEKKNPVCHTGVIIWCDYESVTVILTKINIASYRQCEDGTHPYTTACGYKTPEATCDNPDPEPDTSAQICDYFDCYCNPPTVRDTATYKCVSLEECPKKEKEVEEE